MSCVANGSAEAEEAAIWLTDVGLGNIVDQLMENNQLVTENSLAEAVIEEGLTNNQYQTIRRRVETLRATLKGRKNRSGVGHQRPDCRDIFRDPDVSISRFKSICQLRSTNGFVMFYCGVPRAGFRQVIVVDQVGVHALQLPIRWTRFHWKYQQRIYYSAQSSHLKRGRVQAAETMANSCPLYSKATVWTKNVMDQLLFLIPKYTSWPYFLYGYFLLLLEYLFSLHNVVIARTFQHCTKIRNCSKKTAEFQSSWWNQVFV